MLELIFLKLLAYFVLHVRAIHSSEKSYFLKCVPYLCVNLFSMYNKELEAKIDD